MNITVDKKELKINTSASYLTNC